MYSKNIINLIKKFWFLLIPVERNRFQIIFILIVINTLLETIGLSLIFPIFALLTDANLVDKYPVIQSFFHIFGNSTKGQLAFYVILGFVFIFTIKNLFGIFLTWWQANYAYKVQIRISKYLFSLYLYQPYVFHLQRNSTELFHSIINETRLFSSSIIINATMLVSEIILIVGIVILLLFIDPFNTAIIITILTLSSLFFNHLTKKYNTQWGKLRQHYDRSCFKHTKQGLEGVKAIKLLNKEQAFINKYHINNSLAGKTNVKLKVFHSLPRPWLEELAIIAIAIVVFIMLDADRELSLILPVLSLYVVAAFRVIPSVGRILNYIQTLRFNMPVVDSLYAEICKLISDKEDTQDTQFIFREVLTIDNITFTYQAASRPSLRNISLKINYGQSIGIFGGSGSGKTTLVDIILGLLTPDSGNITADDQNINNALRCWQKQTGYIPQSIYLTDDTLRRNIAFGIEDEKISEEAINKAIKAAHLEEYVANLPDGLDTLVGEFGVRLSGGQLQRVGIARALYHDPAVLILDEATSSLDNETESNVMKSVYALQGEKTLIIIAHRLSTIEHCDYLYKLKDGCVDKEGIPYDVLFRKDRK